MRFSVIVLILCVLGPTCFAQKEISPDRMLFGNVLIDGQFKQYLIKFRRGNKYNLWELPPRGQSAKKETGKWFLAEERLTLIDNISQKKIFVLERQKGQWILPDEKQAYIKRGEFWPYHQIRHQRRQMESEKSD
jgi:hypothetical protein